MSQDLIARLAELRSAFDRLEANVAAAARHDRTADRYRDFSRAASDWVWETDARLNLTYVSDGIARAFGVPGQALIGSYVFALNRFREVGDSLLDLVEAMEAHKPFRNVALTVTAPDGVNHPILLSGVPVFGEDGAFAGYRGAASDPALAVNRGLSVVGRDAADAAPEAPLGAAVGTMPAAPEPEVAGLACWTWQPMDDLFRVQGALRERLGLKDADATIECWYRRVHAEDLPRVKDAFRRHAEGGAESIELEHRMIAADGAPFWVISRGRAAPRLAGGPLRIFGASFDVTALAAEEVALRDACRTAESASRAKTAFLTHLSHELRTPLNAIIGFSEALKDGVFGTLTADKAREYSADIHAAGNHLLQLIDDILDLSRVEAGEMVLDESEVDVEQAVAGAVRLVEGMAERKGLSLNVAYGGDLPLLYGDARVVKQVALNLLSNAVKFTPDRGMISVRAVRRGDGGVRIEVSDTGIGISESDLAKVLTPFGRVTGDLAVTPEGVGLGLPLSKSLVELHGGTLELRSAKGCGTDAVVDFPAHRSRRAAATAMDGTA